MAHVNNMALVRSQVAKGALHFSNRTCSSYLLNVDGCQTKNAVYALSLSRGYWSGSCPIDQNNAGEIFNSPPSREVTGAVQPACYATGAVQPACYATTETLLRSTRLRCWTKSKPPSMSWVERMTSGEQCLLGNLWGPGRVFIARAYSGSSSEPLYRTKTGYYDILQVSAGATHAQIKTAYYKQSFLYHPDRNAGGEEATLRFSDISEAYNVLGNKALKKKYDRGILSRSDLVGSSRPSATETSSSTQQPPRARHSVMGVNSQDVFDFDNFIKSHYGGQLQKQRELQVRKEEMMRKKYAEMHEWKMDNILMMAVGALFVFAVAIVFSLRKGK